MPPPMKRSRSNSDDKSQRYNLTMEEDKDNVEWFWDFCKTDQRALRLSLSSFVDAKDSSTSQWFHLKLFKADADGVHRISQQVILRPVEIYKFFETIQFSNEGINKGIMCGYPGKKLSECKTFKISDHEDSHLVHWFCDIYQTARRKMRVSHQIYNSGDPVTSSYVQLKLFCRASEEEQFTQKYLINLKLGEFKSMVFYRENLMTELERMTISVSHRLE